MNHPLVSVIITSYNHEKYIRQAIEGCLAQKTSFDYDIIIHDDASTDQTANIIREYTKAFPEKIIPILQNENQWSKGVNKFSDFILPTSKGKYLARCEGDDYWIDPKKLEKQVSVMEKDPDIIMCFTATLREFVRNNRKKIPWRYYRLSRYVPTKHAILRGGEMSDLVSTMIRKEIYQDIPEWYHQFPAGDVALNLLAATRGKIFYLDEITAVYRAGVNDSATRKKLEDPQRQKQVIKKSLDARISFNEFTHYAYQPYIIKRLRNGIKHYLFLSSDNKVQFIIDHYGSWLSAFDLIEYRIIKTLGAYQLWRKYRYLLRLITQKRWRYLLFFRFFPS